MTNDPAFDDKKTYAIRLLKKYNCNEIVLNEYRAAERETASYAMLAVFNMLSADEYDNKTGEERIRWFLDVRGFSDLSDEHVARSFEEHLDFVEWVKLGMKD